MGPLTLLDFVGLDTTYYITHVMFDEFKERRFASPPLLKRLVMAGWYGRKTGRGFYDYADPEKTEGAKSLATDLHGSVAWYRERLLLVEGSSGGRYAVFRASG